MKSKDFYKHIFVILTYKNINDIEGLIASIASNVSSYKIIVVNSYYDEFTRAKINSISKKNNCDFINVENKGYGYGNNKGIKYALTNYTFDYLIISNPDIIIEFFSDDLLDNSFPAAYGPAIRTSKGKRQNPYWVYNNKIAEWLIYCGYRYDFRILLYAGVALNKIIREFFMLIFDIMKINKLKVYALHGSFVVLNYKLLQKINPPYDEKIFLFGEEVDLAYKIKKAKANSYIVRSIGVTHKEDGSVGISAVKINEEAKKSVLYIYNKNKRP